MFGHIQADGETSERCMVTFLGERAMIRQWNPDTKRFTVLDTLIDYEQVDKKGRIELTGVSLTLRDVVGLAVDQSKVRVEVTLKECEGCS